MLNPEIDQHEKWLIDNWIPRKALIMLHAPRSAGKTFAAIDMGMHIANGIENWCNNKVKKANVAFFAGNINSEFLLNRFSAWNIANRDVVSINESNASLYFDDHGYLNTAKDFYRIVSSIEKCLIKPDLIIIDSLSPCLSNEKLILDLSIGLKEYYDCSLLLTHHKEIDIWRPVLDVELKITPPSYIGDQQYLQKLISSHSKLDSVPIHFKEIFMLDTKMNRESSSLVMVKGEDHLKELGF